MITDDEIEQIRQEKAELIRSKFTWLDIVDVISAAPLELANKLMQARKINDEAEIGFCIRDIERDYARNHPDFEQTVQDAINDYEQELREAS